MIIFSDFLLTNDALVRAKDDQGVFPRETSYFDPLLVQEKNCPGRRLDSTLTSRAQHLTTLKDSCCNGCLKEGKIH